MALPKYTKDPNARLDYGEDWTDWLTGAEVVVDHTVEVTGAAVVEASSIVDAGRQVVAWISGGDVGETCVVTMHIVTDQEREDDRSFSLVIKQR